MTEKDLSFSETLEQLDELRDTPDGPACFSLTIKYECRPGRRGYPHLDFVAVVDDCGNRTVAHGVTAREAIGKLAAALRIKRGQPYADAAKAIDAVGVVEIPEP